MLKKSIIIAHVPRVCTQMVLGFGFASLIIRVHCVMSRENYQEKKRVKAKPFFYYKKIYYIS